MSIGARQHRAEAVRKAVLDAAADLMLAHGDGLTVEDVAVRAGVGRRTIFRYFRSKDELVAEATATFFRRLVEAIPARDGREIREWLLDVGRIVHDQNLRISKSFLPMVHRRREIPGVSMFIDRPGRVRRYQLMERLAQETWTACGGPGAAPQSVAQLFTLQLSVFASEALRLHCRLDAEQMAELTVHSILALVDAELSKRSGSPGAKRRLARSQRNG